MIKRTPGARGGKPAKKSYRKPRLTVHGDIRALTRSKAGTKSDGGGKPATRATGATA